jgi:hypothetical protein
VPAWGFFMFAAASTRNIMSNDVFYAVGGGVDRAIRRRNAEERIDLARITADGDSAKIAPATARQKRAG